MLPVEQAQGGQTAKPHISDAKSCRQWLQNLPLTNVPGAHAEILVQIDLLNQSQVRGIERLKILELLREPVHYLQAELAKKYAGKPLPFDHAELSLWKKAIHLWQGLLKGYQLCLESAHPQREPETAPFFAYISHRIVRTIGQLMLEYDRAYQPLPEDLWRQLHKHYSLVEERGAARQAIKDPLNRMTDLSSVEAAYVAALLVHLADPYHLTARQLAQLDRWLEKWAARVSVVRQRPEPMHAEFKPATITVDLARPAGATMLHDIGLPETGRYLDTNQLAVTLIKRIRHLRKGGSPAELDMGDECVQPGCETFLTMLYEQWCEPLPLRSYDRRASGSKAQVAVTMAAIHFYCNGEKLLRQPGQAEDMSWREMQDMQLFGHVSKHSVKTQASQLGYALENWRIVDDSALGFRLAADGLHAARTTHNQLVGLRPPDAKNFALGYIRWIRFVEGGHMQVGVRTFPGIPMAIGVRQPVLIAGLPGKYQPAFLLPEIPAIHEPATLILPPGWYGPKKPLEILFEDNLTVHLAEVLEKGADFERVTFAFK
jgi:hypothetical protein